MSNTSRIDKEVFTCEGEGMNEGRFLALFFCALIGMVGFPMLADALSEFAEKFGVYWIVFWWLPPLATIWVKGIFG